MKKVVQHLTQKIQKINEIREAYKKKAKPSLDIKHKKETPEIQKVEIEIASSTLIKILFIFALFLMFRNLVVEIQSILIIAVISFFLAMGLSPIVSKIESYRIPRPLAILILYIGFLGVLGLLFVKVIPIIAEQLLDISYDIKAFILNGEMEKLPLLAEFFKSIDFDTTELQSFLASNIAAIADNLQSVAGSTFSILSGIFQGVFNLIFALVLMFFILMEREQIGNFALLLFPSAKRSYVQTRFVAIQSKMAEWFRGQFILMICMGTFMYVGMKIFEIAFGMKYAAAIGLVAGIMEIFPYIGVFITGLISILVAMNIGWWLVLFVMGWIALAQFLEGNFLIPVIMNKAVGLSSVVIMIAIALGGVLGSALGGPALAILGMIFAVPIAATVAIFVQEYAHRED